MSSQKFLVTGATGKTGRHTVRHLLEKGHTVRAIVHEEDGRSQTLRSWGAEIMVGNLLNHDDVLCATSDTSAAYFCYPAGPGIIQATAYFADAAKRAGLGFVVYLSQISAREDSKSHAARDQWISERILDWSGVPTAHLRPTIFSEMLLFEPFRRPIVEQGVIDLPFADGRHAPIAAEDQARLIATMLAGPAEHIGKTYTLHGPTEMSQAEIAAAISEVIGREVTYRPLTITQYQKQLEAADLPEPLIQHFCEIAIDYQNGLFSGEDKIIVQLTGKAPMGVRDFVALHRDAFGPSNAVS